MKTVAALFLLSVGCAEPLSDCVKTSECNPGELCHAGECVQTPAGRRPKSSTVAEDLACGRAPAAKDLVINEILFAVPEGEDGDANRDGYRDAFEDEFVELVNASDDVLSLRGVSIHNGSKQKFAFTGTCLQPAEAIVVFGGGLPTGIPNAIISDRRLGLSNAGGRASLEREGVLLDDVSYGGASDRSLNRDPDVRGEFFRPHAVTPFSPGVCEDGRTFGTGCD